MRQCLEHERRTSQKHEGQCNLEHNQGIADLERAAELPAPPSLRFESERFAMHGATAEDQRQGRQPGSFRARNHSSVQSVVISSNRGVPTGAIARNAWTPRAATPIPAVPPSSASRQLSTRHCRCNLPDEAPKAARMAISRCRPQPRASNRLVRFAHAISSTNVVAPSSAKVGLTRMAHGIFQQRFSDEFKILAQLGSQLGNS